MTEEQMRAKSASKVKQVLGLMKILSIRCEAKEKISEEGFIEKLVYWIDDEKYQMEEVSISPVVGPVEPSPEATAPTGETAE